MRPRILALSTLMLLSVIALGIPSSAAAAGGDSITSPDAGNVGSYTSLALDAVGNPVVSYQDSTNGDLKVLHCNDPNCAGGDESITSPDTTGHVGFNTSLVLDVDGNPVVAYHNSGSPVPPIQPDDLKVLHCNDPNCDTAVNGPESITSPDTVGQVGSYTSLALDAVGNPVVSYYDFTNRDLKVLHCNDPNCSGGDESITSPDAAGEGDIGPDTSLALDSSGNPVVAYFGTRLKVLHCNDPNCVGSDESITEPDSSTSANLFPSLALDVSGNPVISYYSNQANLKVLHCDDSNCSGDETGNIAIVDPAFEAGQYTSLALGIDGSPIVSYWVDNGLKDLVVLRCGNPTCTSGNTITAPDTQGDVGRWTSLVLDATDRPVVSYSDASNGDLKLLHCGDVNCAGAKPVGGIAELPEVEGAALEAGGSSGPKAGVVAGIVAAAITGALALGGAAWYRSRGGLR